MEVLLKCPDCGLRPNGKHGVLCTNPLAIEVQRRMDAVVDAAVDWHLSDEDWFDKAEILEKAIDSLLDLRVKAG